MPLSEHEQRLLDQIERALYAEDPKFATNVRQTDLRTHMRRRLRRAAVVFVVGFVLLLVGVGTSLWVGVAGFLIMFGALVLALSAWRRVGMGNGGTLRTVDGRASRPTRSGSSRLKGRPGATRSRRPRTSGSLRERLEERWQRRWDQQNGQ